MKNKTYTKKLNIEKELKNLAEITDYWAKGGEVEWPDSFGEEVIKWENSKGKFIRVWLPINKDKSFPQVFR